MRDPTGIEEVFIRTERQFVEKVSGEPMTDVEARVGLFRQQVLPVLRDHGTGTAAAADGAGIVDGVAVGVGRAQTDAALQPFAGR